MFLRGFTLGSFPGDLRRRHVIRVAGVYAAVGFVVLQAAAPVSDGLMLPGDPRFQALIRDR